MTPVASLESTTFNPDDLLVSGFPLKAEKITLKSGQNCVRGTVLGRVAGAVTTAAAGAGVAGANTGDGTIGTVTLGAGAKEGVYKIVFIEPATNLGTFIVIDPDGVEIGQGVVGTAFAGPINFTIADGATDFVSGDGFKVTVAAGTKYVKSASAATDGSGVARRVLAHDCDASGGDKEAEVYELAGVNQNQLTFGTGHSAATVRDSLKAEGIHLIDVGA